MESKETRHVVDSGKERNPPKIQNSTRHRDDWKKKLKDFKEGDIFEWSLPGWKSVNKNYVTDKVTICLEIGKDGALGCASGDCVHHQKRWFGLKVNTRGESNVHKHLVAFHTPKKFGKKKEGTTIRGSGMTVSGKKRNFQNTTIDNFFVSVTPSKKSKEGDVNIDTSPKKSCIDSITTNESPVKNLVPEKNNQVTPESKSARRDVMLCVECSPDKGADRRTKVAFSGTCAPGSQSTNAVTTHIYKPYYISEMERNQKEEAFPCKGIQVELTEPREQHFPLLVTTKLNNPKFIFDLELGNVRSKNCLRWVFQQQPFSRSAQSYHIQCTNCKHMNNDEQLEDIAQRSRDDSFHLSKSNLEFFTAFQMRQKINHSRRINEKIRLDTLSSNRKMKTVCRRLDQMKQLQTCLATDRIPRVQQILKRMIKENRSTKVAIDFLNKAASGEYRPKGFDERDLDMGILDNHIGGRRLIYAHNHSVTHMGPSARTVKRYGYVPQLLPLSSRIDKEIIESNLERFMFNEKATSDLDRTERCLHTIMMDDVKTEKRLRIHEASEEAIGMCYHAHMNGIPTKITSYDDCTSIKAAFDDGEVHYATEMTTVAIGPNRESQHQIAVVGCSGGCLNDDPQERCAELLKITMRTYINNEKGQKMRGHLGTFQPDGAGTFGKIGQEIFLQKKMNSSHPLHPILSKLPLFNLYTNEGEFQLITIGCELKHTFKRLRERLKSDTGVKFRTVTFNRDLITKLLKAKGVQSSKITTMFAEGYADAMNVPAMVDLFQSIALLESMEPKDSFGSLQGMVNGIHSELKLFIEYCSMIHTVLVGKVSLTRYMTILSTLMHINLVCYRENGTKFIPAQNYQNQMRLYRSQYWSMALAKTYNYKHYFPFLDSGDRLEEGFGLVRTLSGGASGTGDGMDALQCVERLGGVNQCNTVYARNPDLQMPSRHLQATKDHMNPRSYLLTEDGKQDYSRVETASVSLEFAYTNGRREAKDLLKAAGYEDQDVNWFAIGKEEDVDMLRPQGDFVGVSNHSDPPEKEAAMDLDKIDEIKDTPMTVLLEEELGGIPNNHLDCNEPLIKRTFMVDGQEITAGSCLRRVMNTELRSETSRMSRYRNIPKSGTEIQDTHDGNVNDNDNKENDMIHAYEQPFATIVVSKGTKESRLVLALISPSHFCETPHGKKVSAFPKEKLVGSAIVSGAIIPAQVNDKSISWVINARSVRTTVELQARNCVLLNPDQSAEDGQIRFSLDMDVARSILEKLQIEYEAQSDSRKSVLYELGKSCTELPYKSGKTEVLTSVLETNAQVLSSRSQSTETREQHSEVLCPVPGCNERFPLKAVRHHASWHIQHDDELLDKLQETNGIIATKATELCGICAVFPSITQTAAPPNDRCVAWLEKKKKAIHFKYQCQNHPTTTMSYKSALKTKKGTPSTNLPIACPECSNSKLSQAFYKYNFQNHWNLNHKDKEMPDELKEQIVVTDEELKVLKSFEKAKSKVAKKRSQKKTTSTQSQTFKFEKSTTRENQSSTVLTTPATPDSPKRDSSQAVLKMAEQEPHIASLLSANLPDYEQAMANSIIDASIAELHGEEVSYNYQNEMVKQSSVSTLQGCSFINDELMNMVRSVINQRSLDHIRSNPSSATGCFVVSSYFMSQLLGDMKGTREEKRFTRREYSNLSLGMKSWMRDLYKGSMESTLTEMVRSRKIAKLVFQVNIPEYHWFAVELNFQRREIVAHCSLVRSLLQDLNSDAIVSQKEEDNILTALEKVSHDMSDDDQSLLKTLCERNGIKHTHNTETTLQNLYRPMALQEIYGFLLHQNKSQDASKRIEMKDWKLILSSSMPQQSAGSNACALYASAVSDVLSVGEQIASIDGTQLENNGRTNMAYICCMKYGKENN